MVEHALKLIWNRRRANALVIIEVAAAFVVVFVVVALTLRAWSNYQRPLGFTYENVWQVVINNESAVQVPGQPPAGLREATDDVLAALRLLPGVEAAHAIRTQPFVHSFWMSPMGRDANNVVRAYQNAMSADALAALGIHVVEGRLFGPQDEGQDYIPALVSRVFVERAFGGESPVGARINFLRPEVLARMPAEMAALASREVRVVGIIDDFRQYGEFSEAEPLVIQRLDPSNGSRALFVKVAPGTQRAFEERLIATVEAAAPGWHALVTPWEQLRTTMHQETLRPLRMGATLGAFLLTMVVLGLIGIVWQDVVRRTQEIGLRRAAGASAARVRRQIVLETVVVAVFGVAIGTVMAVQFPLLELVARIDWASALPALMVSALLIVALAALAALYPAWLAARREPADALRYE